MSTVMIADSQFKGRIRQQARHYESDLGYEALKEARVNMNAQTIMQHTGRTHADAIALARDLEHIYEEEVQEDFAPPNVLGLLHVDRSVRPGAEFHTVRKWDLAGEPEVYDGQSTEVPTVGLDKIEERFNVSHYVLGVEWDLFEEKSDEFSRGNLKSQLDRAFEVSMLNFANRKTIFGDNLNKIQGMVNYTYVPKRVFPTSLTKGASASDLLFELEEAWANPSEVSKETREPNRVVSSRRVKNFYKRRYPGDDERMSVFAKFMENNEVQSWDTDPQLEGTGPGGTDIMVFYNDSPESISNVIVEEANMLPIQFMGFKRMIPGYMSHGGIIMRKPLGNVVCYVTFG